MAFLGIEQIRDLGALDQARVMKREELLVLNLGESSPGVVGLLDLQGTVRVEPFLVFLLVSFLVGSSSSDKLL